MGQLGGFIPGIALNWINPKLISGILKLDSPMDNHKLDATLCKPCIDTMALLSQNDLRAISDYLISRNFLRELSSRLT